METDGYIFDIKHFAVHDGPGIRTTVFLKGCSLHCIWCHNPEGIQPQPELVRIENRCIHCGACVTACQKGAHEIIAGEMVYHRERCEQCGACRDTCYADALLLYGRKVDVEQVMTVLRQDEKFYQASGGGITLSGGEPLLQAKFTSALLRQCKAEGFHTALDTCGNIPWHILENVLPYTDLLLYDLKHLDAEQHQRYTGASNATILDNLRRLDQCRVALEIRIPLIPTINDGTNLSATCTFLKTLEQRVRVRLLPYHSLSGGKYLRLGRVNNMPVVESPSAAQMQAAADQLRDCGCEVFIE